MDQREPPSMAKSPLKGKRKRPTKTSDESKIGKLKKGKKRAVGVLEGTWL